MKKENYRHGDVILKRVDKIPSGAINVTPEKGSLVLAEGESTGHSHKFPPGIGQLFKFNEKLYVEITKEAKIDHEEHGPGEVAPSFYEVPIQNEWQENGWTRIID